MTGNLRKQKNKTKQNKKPKKQNKHKQEQQKNPVVQEPLYASGSIISKVSLLSLI